MRVRAFAAFLLFVLVFSALVCHLYKVQILRHEELLEKGRKKYSKTVVTNGNMGEIFDHSGYLLVGNRPYGVIFADPSAIPAGKLDQVTDFLTKELSLDRRKVLTGLSRKTKKIMKNGKKITLPNQYFLLKTRIPYEEFEQHRKNINSRHLKFVHCRTEYSRYYPKGGMLANILGLSTRDSKGRITGMSGMEKIYEKSMRPVSGERTFDRTRDGLPIAGGATHVKPEKDGINHYLTIREPIQAILEEELDKLVAEHQPKSAYAIMADPYTGDILAMAQRPSFNPNDRSNMNSNSWRNRMAEDVFEPGSIIKPFAVAGALDRMIVTPDTVFDCENGRWRYGGHPLKDDHRIGKASVKEIIKQSSNIGTAKIAVLMGKYAVDDTLRSFGFGQYSGLQLPYESKGLYRNVEKWAKVSLTRIPIGHGMAASPLQLVRGYCMLANGGHPVKLRLLDRFVTADGKVHKIPRPAVKSIYRRKETHREIVDMMKLVTEPGGTAAQAAIRGYHVAGKTGTAQKVINGKYSSRHHIASFMGFVPADNPRLVLLVTADEPSGKSSYGGSVAGPYFRNIAGKTLRYWCVPPDVPLNLYDARRHLAEKRVLAAKIKLWEAERKAKEARRSRNHSGTNNKKTELEKSGEKVSRHDSGNTGYKSGESAGSRKKSRRNTSGRYYGTYTAMMKKY